MPNEKPLAIFFWRRIDQPGCDCCRLIRTPGGWLLSGAAVFSADGRRCHLRYEVATDADWITQHARVSGFAGNSEIDFRVRALKRQRWTLDGEEQPGVKGLVDLDLGFTPATNLIAIRRLALRVGQQTEAPAAYLAFPNLRLEVLQQTYRRSGRLQCAYEAPRFGYKAQLDVSALGAVVRYPGLFEQIR